MTKKEIKLQYNKTKKSLNKNSEFAAINNSLQNVNKLINANLGSLAKIQDVAKNIIKKSGHNDPNKIIDSMPVENLKELAGDFSGRITYKDIVVLNKLHRDSSKVIEKQETLDSERKIISIELLQKQIELLLDGND